MMSFAETPMVSSPLFGIKTVSKSELSIQTLFDLSKTFNGSTISELYNQNSSLLYVPTGVQVQGLEPLKNWFKKLKTQNEVSSEGFE